MTLSRSDFARQLAKDPRAVVSLLAESEKWPCLSQPELRNLVFGAVVIYGIRNDASMIPSLQDLYSHCQSRTNVGERLAIFQDIAACVSSGQCSTSALLPFLLEDDSPTVIASATIAFASYQPLSDGDPLTGPRMLLDFFQKGWSKRRAAIFAGLVQLGDRRVLRLLEAPRGELSVDEVASLPAMFTSFAHAGVVDFYLDWIQHTDDAVEPARFAYICAALAVLGRSARASKGEKEPVVTDVEREFPAPPDGEGPGVRILHRYSLAEYARMIAPRLRTIAERETGERLLPHVMNAWGIAAMESEPR